MRLILIALCLYVAALSWLIWDGYRIEATVHEAMTTVGFDKYLEYVSAFDQKTPTPRRGEIEAWALSVDLETVEAVNVRCWIKQLREKKERNKK